MAPKIKDPRDQQWRNEVAEMVLRVFAKSHSVSSSAKGVAQADLVTDLITDMLHYGRAQGMESTGIAVVALSTFLGDEAVNRRTKPLPPTQRLANATRMLLNESDASDGLARECREALAAVESQEEGT